jgi:hypothetical protein
MKAALEELGWTVDLVRNGTLEQMESATGRLKNRLSANRDSYGFFFYAGHGVQSSGENYLIPVDAVIQSENLLRQRAMSVQHMLDELNAAGNVLNVVVLDAYRDNPFGWSRSGSRGLALMANQPADSIIVYATAAQDGAGRNGLFTGHFLEQLKTPGLEVNELFRRTGQAVRQDSGGAQIPALYSQFFETAWLGAPPATPEWPAARPENPASSQVSAQGQGFEQLGGSRLQMAYAAYRKLLRDYEGQITQFKVLSVMPLVNMYGQQTLSRQVIRVDINGNGRWDDNVDASIMLSHTAKIYHNVQAGDVVCLPVGVNDLEDDNTSGADWDTLAAELQARAAKTGAAVESNDGPNLEYTIGKKFKGGLEYFRPLTDLYDVGLKPIAVFKPKDARYGRIAPFAGVYYVKSSRDRDSVHSFLDSYRGDLAGNNPHVYDAFNILAVSRILAVNGVPVEFMDEMKPEERARLMQDSWENSENIRKFYAQNAR